VDASGRAAGVEEDFMPKPVPFMQSRAFKESDEVLPK
jgi:hypothetical protein